MTNDSRFRALDEVPLLTTIACAMCLLSFAGLTLQGDSARWEAVAPYGFFPPGVVWEGKPWALLTSVFVHREIWHVVFNVYWLWILGGILERSIGPLRWLMFFLAAAWISSAAQLATGNQGIGMSGVGYALFGFGAVAREKIPAFKRILTPQTVGTFLIWFVGCYIFTLLGLARIGNEAHLAGMLFGAAVALVWMAWTKHRAQALGAALGVFALAGLSFVPLLWCPLSPEWTGQQAVNARIRGDYPTAVSWYERSLNRGQDPAWAWRSLAEMHALRGEQAQYAHALNELRKASAQDAEEVEAENGPPQNAGSGASGHGGRVR